MKEGIPNSDLHIYVTVLNDEYSNNIASGNACIIKKRPIFGEIIINIAAIH